MVTPSIQLPHGRQTAPVINIVGAGPGGLASAILLQAAGLQTRVFERMPHVGGRTSSIKAEGYTFDLGPTFFMYPKVLAEIFQVAGRRLEDEVELIKLDPHYRLIFEQGGSLQVTPQLEEMKRQIALLNEADAAGFEYFMADNRTKLALIKPVLEMPFSGWSSLLDSRLLQVLPVLRPLASVEGDLRRFFQDERVRLAFSFQSKYLGMSPYKCPSPFTILSFLEYEYGIYHPIGGCAALTAAMARVAGDLGAEIHLDEPVTKIDFDGARAIGLQTAHGSFPADATILNADFARALEKLTPDGPRRRWKNSSLAKKQYSCSTFMLYLGIEGRYDHLDHHTILISDAYQENLRQITDTNELPLQPSLYVQNASVTDPTLAPEGHSTLYVLVPVPNQNSELDWSAEAPRYRQLVLDRLKSLGLDDLESRIRFEKMITPAEWDVDYEIFRGATFNLSHTLGQMLHLRPRNRFEEFENTYLVGGGTHPGSGLPVIFEGARISCKLLLEDLGLDPELLTPDDTQLTSRQPDVTPVSRQTQPQPAYAQTH
jgi:phytoene desaturase